MNNYLMSVEILENSPKNISLPSKYLPEEIPHWLGEIMKINIVQFQSNLLNDYGKFWGLPVFFIYELMTECCYRSWHPKKSEHEKKV